MEPKSGTAHPDLTNRHWPHCACLLQFPTHRYADDITSSQSKGKTFISELSRANGRSCTFYFNQLLGYTADYFAIVQRVNPQPYSMYISQFRPLY